MTSKKVEDALSFLEVLTVGIYMKVTFKMINIKVLANTSGLIKKINTVDNFKVGSEMAGVFSYKKTTLKYMQDNYSKTIDKEQESV